MGINQRVSLRKFTDDIRRWVEEDRSDEWIASALGTSPSSVQSFRSRNAIYRRHATTSTLYDPQDYSSYEGVLETEGPGVWFDPEIGKDPRWHKRWKSTERVQLRLTPTRIVLLRRGGARGQRRPVRECFGTRGANVGDRPKAVHDTFDAFMEIERARIQEHASGKMARALGHALPGESQEDLDRKAQEDQRLAQEGIVKLKVGEEIHYKHIDELTREDRQARMAAEREEVDWLMQRVRLRKERSR